MIDTIIKDKTYNGRELRAEEFDGCTFEKCTFTDCDLSEAYFRDCVFMNCNLSMAKLENTLIKDCVFENCKLSGLEFGTINPFMFAIECKKCIMNYVSFIKNRLEKANFKGCQITDAIFSECNLQKAVFADCDLQNTVFMHNNMQKADFTTSVNYVIDPEINRMKGASFGLRGLYGLLVKYDIKIDASL